jgi:hypothetical protein
MNDPLFLIIKTLVVLVEILELIVGWLRIVG